MLNPGSILEQFLGPNALQNLQQAGGTAKQKLDGVGGGGFAGGAVAGGLLGLMLGNKKMRKMAGGLMSYGAAAGAGALAFQAYQNWKQGTAVATSPAAVQADVTKIDRAFMPHNAPALGGQPFELVLVRAMIAAAKSDGHIDAAEQQKIFEHVEKLGLDAESKAFVFDALTQPADPGSIAAAASGIEQASEIYLVSRLAIDPDQAAERAYLQALGHRLNLPADLMAHLDHQVETATTV
jgi:uncharacterized membrane protein YebE (DUF533 family)